MEPERKCTTGLLLVGLALGLAAGLGAGYVVRGRQAARDLQLVKQLSNQQLSRAREQIDNLTEQLDALRPAPTGPIRLKPLPASGDGASEADQPSAGDDSASRNQDWAHHASPGNAAAGGDVSARPKPPE